MEKENRNKLKMGNPAPDFFPLLKLIFINMSNRVLLTNGEKDE